MKKITTEKNGRVRVQTVNDGNSKTRQEFKDMTDINKMVAKYQETGEWTHITRKEGVYADVSGIQALDYQASLSKVLAANEAFMQLDPELRARFQNDPAQLLEFVQDQKNYDEGVKLGLFEPKQNGGSQPIKNDQTNQNTAEPPKQNQGSQSPS